MNNYQLIANKEKLDTFEDFNISLNYAITDITDITKRKTNFSKTIELPGTPNNNLFFKQIFDVNIDNITFNPTFRPPVTVRVGDNDVITGNLQLINVVVNNNEITYEVVIAGTLKNIISDIKDYYLTDLDLSEYNHIRNRDNIIDSWDYKVRINGNLTSVDKGIGYVYPYIVNGNSSDIFDNWYVYDTYPSIYVKTYMDKLFQFAGYTYTSEFFNSDYFKSLIIPYNSDLIQLSEEEIEEKSVIVGVDGSKPERITGSVATGYADWFGDHIIEYDDPWYYDGVVWPYLSRESGTVGSVEFRNNTSSTENRWFNQRMEINQTGYYDISFDGKLVPKWFSDDGQDIRWKGDGVVQYIYYLIKIDPSGANTILDQSGVGPFPPGIYGTQDYVPSNTSFNSSPWYDTEALLNVNLSANNVWLEDGSFISIRFGVRWPSTVKWDIDGVLFNQNQKMNLRMTLAESIDGQPTQYSIRPSTNENFSTTTPINMNQVSHKIKMESFFLDIVKMFNLIIQDNPNKENDLIIEPRDDYFESKQKVLDWNLKIDNDSDKIMTPMSELDFDTYTFTYKEDSDYLNEDYQEAYKRIWGDKIIQTENNFSKKEEKLQLLFSPTPNGSFNINDRVAPFFAKLENNELSPKKVNYRILFYDGTIQCDEWYLKDFPNSTNYTTLNRYPYTGMFNHPYEGTEDLSFEPTNVFYYSSIIGGVPNPVDTIPNSNLFNRFHKNTFRTINNRNSRLLKAYFHLTPKDIATFDFRDIIFLDGSYWRVNEINNYDPANSDSLTEVILYKEINRIVFDLDTLNVPESNDGCVEGTLISVISPKGNYLTTETGEPISDDCCRSFGLIPSNGICLYADIDDNGFTKPFPIDDGFIDRPDGGTIYSPNSEGVVPIQQTYGPKVLQKDLNTYNTNDVKVIGSGNYIQKNSKKALILGDGNSLVGNTKNTLIIGNNITPTVDNSLYIGNVYIDENGEINNNKEYIIDGGENTVINVNKTNFIDVIDGGENSVRPFGGDSKLRPIIIDASAGSQI